jgi:hypothetical protein
MSQKPPLGLTAVETDPRAHHPQAGHYFGAYTEEDRAKARSIQESGHVMPVTTPQRIKYWFFVGSFVIVWLGVLLLLCPLGVGR